MRILYHLPLSPFSRKVRLALKEKGIDFDLALERVWEHRMEFVTLNPAAQVPVLVDINGLILCDSWAICEYLDEAYPDRRMLGFDHEARAETRRLVAWTDQKFYNEVTRNLVFEKYQKHQMGLGQPDSAAIRAGKHNIHLHLDYFGKIAERRRWLAGDEFGLADLAVAAHLSCIDYLGDVPWDDHPQAKDWYVRMKSRPSFRPLLTDVLPGLPPPEHYTDLDF